MGQLSIKDRANFNIKPKEYLINLFSILMMKVEISKENNDRNDTLINTKD